jgi:Domain of unknown function (DUF6471)
MAHELVIIGMGTDEKARNILKAELAKRGIPYQKLAELLNQRGWKLNKAAIDNRMSRGAFSADFFLDCLRVIGCENIGLLTESSLNK